MNKTQTTRCSLPFFENNTNHQIKFMDFPRVL